MCLDPLAAARRIAVSLFHARAVQALAALVFCAGCATKSSPQPAGRAIETESKEPRAAAAPPVASRSTPLERSSTPAAPLQGAGDAAPAVASLAHELGSLPQDVLVGTDVTPLAEFVASAAAVPSSGTFRSEQGGAVARIQLERSAKGTALTREFREPGSKAQVKRYDGLHPGAGGLRLSGNDVEVLSAGHRIIVLEKHSGVDGIPDSLWIEYEGSSPAAPDKGGKR